MSQPKKRPGPLERAGVVSTDGAKSTAKKPSKRVGQPAPAALRKAIAKGEEVDYAALLRWWETKCPPHLRHLSIDTAALLSILPPLADGASVQVTCRFSTSYR